MRHYTLIGYWINMLYISYEMFNHVQFAAVGVIKKCCACQQDTCAQTQVWPNRKTM